MKFDVPTLGLRVWRYRALCAATAALASACSAKTVPLSQPDPSDPHAAIGEAAPYRPSLSSVTDGEVEAQAPEPPMAHPHAGHGAPASEELVYACPMHPGVHGAEGDTCPKCGMTLTPQEPRK